MQKDSARYVLREGWLDKITSFFKGKPDVDAPSKIADAWISEQEIEIGEDLPLEIKQQVYDFATSRFERAMKAYEDSPDPVRKSVDVIIKLLDKRFASAIDALAGYNRSYVEPKVKPSKLAKKR